MKCTSCKSGTLQPGFIDALFRAHTCDHCGGNWILIEDFVSWKERNPDIKFVEVDVQDMKDTSNLLLCPVTGTAMRKFRISKDNDHRIDYSVRVGGVWLDRGEWDLLKNEGIAGCLNAVLTEQWQQKIREDKARDSFEELYTQKFGSKDYARLKEIRTWLEHHPLKADMRSYLLASDPYSTKR